jgi:conjugal transfer pilus assembly protein TraB
MKQKLQDLILLLKKERKYQLLVIAAIVAVVWSTFQSSNSSRNVQRQASAKQTQLGAGNTSNDETVRDLVRAFRGDIERLSSESRSTKVELDKTRQEMDNNNQRVTDIFKRVLEKMAEQDQSAKQSAANAAMIGSVSSPGVENLVDPADPANGSMVSLASARPPGIDEFSVASAPIIAPPPPPTPRKIAVVGSGDHVRVKLIGAVNAATDGTPYPVLFKVVGDVTGPNGSSLPLGEALVVAAAQGSLSDQRVLYRLNELNLSYPDGSRNVIEIDGWVVGEDGIAGMEGVLIDPIGKAIAGSGMAGLIEGAGRGLQAKNVTNRYDPWGGNQVEITGDEGAYAAGEGLASASRTWSRLIENRIAKLVPVVQVYSGREATAIFSRSFQIKGLIEAYQIAEDSDTSLD